MNRSFGVRLLVMLLGVLWSTAALAQSDVVVPVPYSPKSPTVPHPVHEGAPTTLALHPTSDGPLVHHRHTIYLKRAIWRIELLFQTLADVVRWGLCKSNTAHAEQAPQRQLVNPRNGPRS